MLSKIESNRIKLHYDHVIKGPLVPLYFSDPESRRMDCTKCRLGGQHKKDSLVVDLSHSCNNLAEGEAHVVAVVVGVVDNRNGTRSQE